MGIINIDYLKPWDQDEIDRQNDIIGDRIQELF